MAVKKRKISTEDAEIIALKALDYLAQDVDSLGRFMALTGIGPADLRQRASTPTLLAAVLEHILADESSLLVFCSLNAIPPEDIERAKIQIINNAADGEPDSGPPTAA